MVPDEAYTTVTVPADLKYKLRQYLKQEHNIDETTMFPDIEALRRTKLSCPNLRRHWFEIENPRIEELWIDTTRSVGLPGAIPHLVKDSGIRSCQLTPENSVFLREMSYEALSVVYNFVQQFMELVPDDLQGGRYLWLIVAIGLCDEEENPLITHDLSGVGNLPNSWLLPLVNEMLGLDRHSKGQVVERLTHLFQDSCLNVPEDMHQYLQQPFRTEEEGRRMSHAQMARYRKIQRDHPESGSLSVGEFTWRYGNLIPQFSGQEWVWRLKECGCAPQQDVDRPGWWYASCPVCGAEEGLALEPLNEAAPSVMCSRQCQWATIRDILWSGHNLPVVPHLESNEEGGSTPVKNEEGHHLRWCTACYKPAWHEYPVGHLREYTCRECGHTGP